MIGPRGLENIGECVEDVLERDVPGDLIEAGVWRGGATVFMRALLEAYGDHTRTVWVADSFRGLPTPTESGHEADIGDEGWAEQFWFSGVAFPRPLEDVRPKSLGSREGRTAGRTSVRATLGRTCEAALHR